MTASAADAADGGKHDDAEGGSEPPQEDQIAVLIAANQSAQEASDKALATMAATLRDTELRARNLQSQVDALETGVASYDPKLQPSVSRMAQGSSSAQRVTAAAARPVTDPRIQAAVAAAKEKTDALAKMLDVFAARPEVGKMVAASAALGVQPGGRASGDTARKTFAPRSTPDDHKAEEEGGVFMTAGGYGGEKRQRTAHVSLTGPEKMHQFAQQLFALASDQKTGGTTLLS